jgi:hypothetical protein
MPTNKGVQVPSRSVLVLLGSLLSREGPAAAILDPVHPLGERARRPETAVPASSCSLLFSAVLRRLLGAADSGLGPMQAEIVIERGCPNATPGTVQFPRRGRQVTLMPYNRLSRPIPIYRRGFVCE